MIAAPRAEEPMMAWLSVLLVLAAAVFFFDSDYFFGYLAIVPSCKLQNLSSARRKRTWFTLRVDVLKKPGKGH